MKITFQPQVFMAFFTFTVALPGVVSDPVEVVNVIDSRTISVLVESSEGDEFPVVVRMAFLGQINDNEGRYDPHRVRRRVAVSMNYLDDLGEVRLWYPGQKFPVNEDGTTTAVVYGAVDDSEAGKLTGEYISTPTRHIPAIMTTNNYLRIQQSA